MIKKRSFMWAVEQMKEGKKVRRNCWDKVEFCEGGYPKVCCGTFNYRRILLLGDFEAVDWESYEEPKKTLHKEILRTIKQYERNIQNYNSGKNKTLPMDLKFMIQRCVKDFIKTIKQRINNAELATTGDISAFMANIIIDEAAGEQLK